MSSAQAVIFAVGGLALLAICGDRLVVAALRLAPLLRISPLVTGMFIVGLGTSLPEILLSVQAALAGHYGIAHGNIIGSNIANILLVAGAASVIAPITVNAAGIRAQAVWMLLATLAWIVVTSLSGLSPAIGALWLIGLATWLAAAPAGVAAIPAEAGRRHRPLGDTAQLLLCLAGLPVGATLLIDGATGVAQALGIGEAAIGVTLVAIGTSLPELAAAVAAAARRETDLVAGNVLGSNLFNILAAGGAVALTGTQSLAGELLAIGNPAMAASAFVFSLMVLGAMRIGRLAGVAFLLAYASYAAISVR